MVPEPILILICSLIQAAVSTCIALFLAFPVAYFFYRFRFPGKEFLLASILFFCIMPTKMVAHCITLCYGLRGFPGIIAGHVILNMPFACYVLYAALQTLDVQIELTAASLGATRGIYHKTIMIPYLRSTLLSAAAFIFFLCFASTSIPLLLADELYHHTPDAMVRWLYEHDQVTKLGAYIFFRVSMALVIMLIQTRLKILSCTEPPTSTRACSYGSVKDIVLGCISLSPLFLLLMPFIVLMVKMVNLQIINFWWIIPQGLLEPFLGTTLLVVLGNSLFIALTSATGAVFCALALIVASEKANTSLKRIGVSLSAYIPFVMGTTLMDLIFSSIGQKTGLSFFAVIVCHCVLNYPYIYLLVYAQWALRARELAFLAQSLGACRKDIFITVDVPLVQQALVRGWCVAFGLSLTESAGNSLTGAATMTLPIAITVFRKNGHTNAVYALTILLIFLVIAVSIGMYFFQRLKFMRRRLFH